MSGGADRSSTERSWVAHVRSGGTTPWGIWAPSEVEDDEVADGGREPAPPLPGAAQLELLRRLNVSGVSAERARHVLGRAGPGRGRPFSALPWPAVDRPAAPESEVLRVGIGVLADLAARLPAPAPDRPTRHRRSRTVPTFVLEGPPLTVGRLRADLAAAGAHEYHPVRPWFARRPEKPPGVVLVVVGPLLDGLNEAWSGRVQQGGMQSWRGFLTLWSRRADLPPAASAVLAVDRWVDRVGAANVHVVTTELLGRQVAEVLGREPAGTAQPRRAPDAVLRLSPTLVDVLRRLNAVLPFLVPAEQLAARRTALAQLMALERVGPPRLTFPLAHRRWARTAADGVADQLAASGCTVHGDLSVLSDGVDLPVRRLRAAEVVTATVRMIHRVDDRLDGNPTGGRG